MSKFLFLIVIFSLFLLPITIGSIECYVCNDETMDPPCTRPKREECEAPLAQCAKIYYGETLIKASFLIWVLY